MRWVILLSVLLVVTAAFALENNQKTDREEEECPSCLAEVEGSCYTCPLSCKHRFNKGKCTCEDGSLCSRVSSNCCLDSFSSQQQQEKNRINIPKRKASFVQQQLQQRKERETNGSSTVYNVTMYDADCHSYLSFGILCEIIYFDDVSSILMIFLDGIEMDPGYVSRSPFLPINLGFNFDWNVDYGNLISYFTLDSSGCYWAAIYFEQGYKNGFQVSPLGQGSCSWAMCNSSSPPINI